jgi:hypothetical protein
MAWYDWVLWLGILYMFFGTDFTLNWFSGIAYGQRLDRDSPNFVQRIYYRVWASTDPNARADRVDGPVGVPAPWVTALCATNALATCTIEILLLYGMLQDPLPAYVMPAAFAFLLRAEIEIIYGSQLIWGPARLRGGALINYLAIGLVPQVLIPCLVALRFSGMGLSALSLLLFVGMPVAILVWTWIVYRNNPVPALDEKQAKHA